jgi:hypothetical protein
MWSCRICGREHKELYDACWNCPCRSDPLAARLHRIRILRGFWSCAWRTLFGLAVGVVLAPAELIFYFGVPIAAVELDSLLGVGAIVGLGVGGLWGLIHWIVDPPLIRSPIQDTPGVEGSRACSTSSST